MRIGAPQRSIRRLLRRYDAPPPLSSALALLGKGKLAIDCGANVGDVTVLLARTGADVIAFEPNPVAFDRLYARCARLPNVRCIQAAVSVDDGSARLYLHEDDEADPVRASVGGSLVREKRNVNPDRWIDVETVDLDALVAKSGPVAMLKLDVEGTEVAILERMLESGRLKDIGAILVEMHDWHTQELQTRGAVVREALANPMYDHVRLDWH